MRAEEVRLIERGEHFSRGKIAHTFKQIFDKIYKGSRNTRKLFIFNNYYSLIVIIYVYKPDETLVVLNLTCIAYPKRSAHTFSC